MTRTSIKSPSEKAGRPMLTPDGHRQLAERVLDIRTNRLPALRPLLVEPERDERDVAEFERLLLEADSLDAFLATAGTLTSADEAFDGRIALGMRVEITLADGSRVWVRPVHPSEAFLDEERISVSSPLAVALLGARAGSTVWVGAPAGVWSCTVVSIDSRIG